LLAQSYNAIYLKIEASQMRCVTWRAISAMPYKTDAFEGMEFGNPERPEAQNLLTIYQSCTGMTQEQAGGVVEHTHINPKP